MTAQHKVKLLVFHPAIAPYRIDFFNDLSERFDISLYLPVHAFDHFIDNDHLFRQLTFAPQYIFKTDHRKDHLFSIRYWSIIKKERPDAVLTSEFSANTIMTLLFRWLTGGRFRIITICDDSPDFISGGSKRHRFFRNWLLKKVDDAVFSSDEVTAWSRNKYGKGVFFPIIRDETRARNNYKAALQRSAQLVDRHSLKDKTVVLFVGRLVREKNIGLLIRGFSKCKSAGMQLVIVGDGPERNHLLQIAGECGVNAIFTGRLEGEALDAWYNVATVFVLPSITEPFGAVVNEALLAGCYTLVSDKCGAKCLIVEGDNGSVFPSGSENELSKKLEDYISNAPKVDSVTLRPDLMRHPYSELIKNVFAAIDC